MVKSPIDFNDKFTWLIVASLSFFLYFIYYYHFYDQLLQEYSDQWIEISSASTTSDLNICAGDDVQIKVRLLKYLDSSSNQLALVRLANLSSDKSVEGTFSIYRYFLSGETDSDDSKTNLPILFADKQSAIEKNDVFLYPQAVSDFRVPILSSAKALTQDSQYNLRLMFEQEGGSCYINFEELKGTKKFEESSFRVAQYFLVERVLLPPWANVILPAVAVISVWVGDDWVKRRWGKRFFARFIVQLLLSSFIMLSILSLVYMWIFNDRFASIFVMLLFIIFIVILVFATYKISILLRNFFIECKKNSKKQQVKCVLDRLIKYLTPEIEPTLMAKIEDLNRSIKSLSATHPDKQKSEDLIVPEIKKLVTSLQKIETNTKNNISSIIEVKHMAEKLDVLIEEIRVCCGNRESGSVIQSSHLEKTFTTLQSFSSLLRLYQTKESVSQDSFSRGDREFMEKSFERVLESIEKGSIFKSDNNDAESIAQLEQEIHILTKKIQDLLNSQGYKPNFSCSNCGNTVVPKNAICCHNCGEPIG